MIGVAFLSLFACTGEADPGGGGDEPDVRLISGIHTFGCRDDMDTFLGVRSEEISLEIAPDALEPMELPAPGTCATGLDLFPTSAGPGAFTPEEVGDEVVWATNIGNGTIKRRSAGFWLSTEGGTELTCVEATQVGSLELLTGGPYTGIETPSAPSDGNLQPPKAADDGIDFGEEIPLVFEAPGWDDVWVQLRRERQGEAWETLTCNVTGDSSFTLGAEHWAQLDEAVAVDENELLVVFDVSRQQTLDNGQSLETVTRVITSAFDL